MLIFIIFCVTYFTFGSCALVELNNPCASSFDCSAGAICQAKLCQCPPVYIAAASGCVHAPVPIRQAYPAVAYNAYRHPHPSFVQPVVLPSAPVVLTHQGLWSAAIKAQAASGAVAVTVSPSTAETAATVAPPTESTTSNTVPQSQQVPSLVYTLTEYGYQFAVPGASCLEKQLCLGNSICSLGSCVCPTNYVINGRLCVLTLKSVAATGSNVTTTLPTSSGNDTVNPTVSTPPPVTLPPVPVPVPAVVPETLAEALKSTNDATHGSKLVELKTAPWFNYVPMPLKPVEPIVPLLAPATPLIAAAAPATAIVQAAPVAAGVAANPCSYSNTIIIKELCQQVYSVSGYVQQPQNVIQANHQAYLSKASVEAHAAQLWSKILSHPLYGMTVLDYKPHPYIASEYTRYGFIPPFSKQKRT